MSRILDKSFRYTPAAKTDIRKTFARVRREQAELAEERERKVRALPAPAVAGRK